ncbi:hypothetical protein BC628DRAFT_701028 [Trametes gibbosa]|nr:hypothetical protein BC628DRAFT_701028 [Trametes gibbosa]
MQRSPPPPRPPRVPASNREPQQVAEERSSSTGRSPAFTPSREKPLGARPRALIREESALLVSRVSGGPPKKPNRPCFAAFPLAHPIWSCARWRLRSEVSLRRPEGRESEWRAYTSTTSATFRRESVARTEVFRMRGLCRSHRRGRVPSASATPQRRRVENVVDNECSSGAFNSSSTSFLVLCPRLIGVLRVAAIERDREQVRDRHREADAQRVAVPVTLFRHRTTTRTYTAPHARPNIRRRLVGTDGFESKWGGRKDALRGRV